MKKCPNLTLLSLFLIELGASAQATPESLAEMVNPGDEISDMRFTTAEEIDWGTSLAFLCDWESVEETDPSRTMACFTTPGSSFFFGNFNGIPYDKPEEADELWKNVKPEVTFDGQPVNLPAFGYIQADLYDMEWKYARIWNVMVENITPGTHTIYSTCEYPGEGASNNTYVFTVSDEPDIYPTLSEDLTVRILFIALQKQTNHIFLYIPGDYGVNPDRKWPLLLYLHDLDRVNTSVNVLKNDFPINTLADQDYFPFILIAPQGTRESEFWAKDEMINSIITLLDEIQSKLSVDPNRIYLTGVSLDGNSTWSIGVLYLERFAALAPVMGYYGWPFAVPENICDLMDVPVWAFH